MKRLLSTTTALALALAPMQPMTARAQTMQDDGSVVAPDGTVLCTPTADEACNLKKIKKAYRKAQAAEEPAAEAAPAEDAAAAQQAADEAAAAEAAAAAKKAERKAAKKAEEEAAAAQAAADEAAAAEAAAAQAAADEAAAAEVAAAQPAADEAAAAEAAAAQQAADEAAAAQQATEDAAATEKAAEDADAAEAAQKAADDAAAAEAEAAQKAADEAAAAEQTPATTEPAAEPAEAEPAATDAPAEGTTPDAATTDTPAETTAEVPATDAAPVDATGETPAEVPASEVVSDPATDSSVDAVPPSEESAAAVADILAQPTEDATVAETVTAAAAAEAETTATDPAAPAAGATVTETVMTEDDARTSAEDFTTTSSGAKNDKKKKKKNSDGLSDLSDLQKFGLVALGAVAVGTYLNNRNKVVSNTGDRVVVERDDGSYVIYKDDDALLRQPGSTVKTETFNDGSTRTTVVRADGTQIVTIRDATGRVLKRSAYDARGREVVLIDDLAPETKVDVTTLPKPKPITISAQDNDAALAAALRAAELEDLGRSFSLRQIRDIPQVRALAAMINVDSITFDTGSAAITASEAKKLSALGRFIAGMIAENPGEMFLIEGHTDAVGSAASNLTLSDRRAESVALALTEYYGVPPENLVVQGYGESELLVQSAGDERANRRVAARIITPLLRPAAQ